jgi:hypothetical protein
VTQNPNFLKGSSRREHIQIEGMQEYKNPPIIAHNGVQPLDVKVCQLNEPTSTDLQLTRNLSKIGKGNGECGKIGEKM